MNPVADRPNSSRDTVLRPMLELATRLGHYVDHLSDQLTDLEDEQSRETCLDLMVGLALAADALRAAHGADCLTHDGEQQLRSAIEYLRRVESGPWI